jgi:hypothetical protein
MICCAVADGVTDCIGAVVVVVAVEFCSSGVGTVVIV